CAANGPGRRAAGRECNPLDGPTATDEPCTEAVSDDGAERGTMAARLTLRDVSLSFGGITVLDKVTFEVEPGSIFGLVGPNGAGKTSLFNCISGHYRPTSGEIRIDDVDVLGRRPHQLADVGLARTFQH